MDSDEADQENKADGKTLLYVFERGYDRVLSDFGLRWLFLSIASKSGRGKECHVCRSSHPVSSLIDSI